MSDPKQAEKAYFDAVREGQRAMVDAVGAWAKSVEQLAAAYPAAPEVPGAPTADDVVDNAFDFAEKLLETQREFAHRLLAAAAKPDPGASGESADEGADA
jgi:hypothetical protein